MNEPARTLRPISTLPADATHEAVQLYRNARPSYGMAWSVGGVEECHGGPDFAAAVQDAQYWAPRERPIPVFPSYG